MAGAGGAARACLRGDTTSLRETLFSAFRASKNGKTSSTSRQRRAWCSVSLSKSSAKKIKVHKPVMRGHDYDNFSTVWP